MLSEIKISNYTLIDKLAIEPSNGLNIITGETGAGKSIVLGAVGLLLGQRADGKAVSHTTEKCVIEGVFSIKEYHLQSAFEDLELEYQDETIFRREISNSGKSRLFINDSPTTIEVAKEIGKYLVDIHSQHDTLLLGSASYQLNLIDTYGKLTDLLINYRTTFADYKLALATYDNLKANAQKDKKELDFLVFQLKELQALKLVEGEQFELEEEEKVLENAEFIKSKLSEASQIFSDGVLPVESQLKQAISSLLKLSDFGGSYPDLHARAESAFIELKDVFGQIDDINEEFQIDNSRLEIIQSRLSSIFSLQKKHGLQSLEELIALQKELEAKTTSIISLDDRLVDAENAKNETLKVALQHGKLLSEARKVAAIELINEVHVQLADLAMPFAKLSIDWKQSEPANTGIDNITFLFSANKGIPPAELKQVASGGEFSRLMLCVKYALARKTALPTLIFDEIDSGISGEVGRKVGKMIQEMSQYHQIIAITHLPQIASLAQSHYFVYKDQAGERTVSEMKLLNEAERVLEIATMMSGNTPSPSALAAAKELLAT